METILRKYQQRQGVADEIDYIEKKGGDGWLQEGLDTDYKLGISSKTLGEREAKYSTNRKP